MGEREDSIHDFYARILSDPRRHWGTSEAAMGIDEDVGGAAKVGVSGRASKGNSWLDRSKAII